MAGKPIATVGSMHVCPMCSGIVPHVGGPVTGPGAPNVLINGKPVAVMGDMCTCAGGPDIIVQGCPGVTINGKPVATVGCMTAHGGTITTGEPNVTISSATPSSKSTMSIKEIPFPKITIIDRVGAAMKGKSKDLKDAKKNQEQIKKEAEEQKPKPAIHNVRWIKDNYITREGRIKKKVKVAADVTDIPDGENITFYIERENPSTKKLEKLEVNATVKKGEAIGNWKIIDQIESNHE